MNKNMKRILGTGIFIVLLVLISIPIAFTGEETPIGYKIYNDTIEIWNNDASYYFDESSGVQWTQDPDAYWTKNVFCLGYYAFGQWNKIKCADELSGFNQDIKTDNLTYVNVTLWKDFTYSGYDIRVGIRYHLNMNDTNLSVIIYGKNRDTNDFANDIGFAWIVKDINIPKNETDNIFINDTRYYLNENLDLLFKNMTRSYVNESNETIVEDIPFYQITGYRKYIKLDWNENLNYAVKLYSDGNQSNAYVATLINAGSFSAGQEKSTLFHWKDPEGDYTGEFFSTTDPGVMVPRGIATDNTYIWVTCDQTDEIYKFYMNGTYTREHFDTAGSGNAGPYGMTTDGNYIWISDYQDVLIYKYYMNGTYTNDYFDVSSQMNYPRGMTTDGTYIWIVETVGEKVYKYYINGTYTGDNFSISSSYYPFGITQNGTYFWIVDYSDKIHRYYMNWTYIDYTSTEPGNSLGMINNNTYIWIVDDASKDVYKYYMNRTYTGDHWDVEGPKNPYPYGITNNGTYFWITDNSWDEVYKYYINGTYTGDHWDTASFASYWPYGITQNGTYFWIVDYSADKVFKCYMNGTYIENWSTHSENNDPWGLTTDGTYIWITELTNHRVFKYHMNGTYIENWTTNTGNLNPRGITTNGQYIWVLEWNFPRVFKYHMNGTYTGTNWYLDSANQNPNDLTIKGRYIWVTDFEDDLVYKYEGPSSCICPNSGSNWEVDLSENCEITEDCDIGTGKLSFTENGIFNCNATITTTDLGDPGNGNIIYIDSNCMIYING